MNEWYRVDPNRFTCRELWRLSGRGLLPFALALYRKFFNVQLPVKYGYAFPPTLQLIELSRLPDRPGEALGTVMSIAERHGFRFVFCQQGITLGDTLGFSMVLVNSDGMTFGNATWVKTAAREEATFVVSSRVEDRLLLTSNEPRRIDYPPEFDIWHLPGKSIDDLVEIHWKRINKVSRSRLQPAVADQAVQRVLANRQRYHEFQRARGVHAPMTREEVERLSGITARNHTLAGDNPYQAPQEDESEADSVGPSVAGRKSWQTSLGAGFLGGAIFGEAIALVQLQVPLAEPFSRWELTFGLFVAFPLMLGIIGGGIGLAAWVARFAFWRLVRSVPRRKG